MLNCTLHDSFIRCFISVILKLNKIVTLYSGNRSLSTCRFLSLERFASRTETAEWLVFTIFK
jgi:hypothetical protein